MQRLRNFPREPALTKELEKLRKESPPNSTQSDRLLALISKREPAYRDQDNGPVRSWLYVHQDMSDKVRFETLRLSLQLECYVLWNQKRLVHEGFFVRHHEPHKPITLHPNGALTFRGMAESGHEGSAWSLIAKKTLWNAGHTGYFNMAVFSRGGFMLEDVYDLSFVLRFHRHRPLDKSGPCAACEHRRR